MNDRVICKVTIKVVNSGHAIKSDDFMYDKLVLSNTGADAFVYSKNGIAYVECYCLVLNSDGSTQRAAIGDTPNKAQGIDANGNVGYYNPFTLYVDNVKKPCSTITLSDGLHSLKLVLLDGASNARVVDEMLVYVDNRVNISCIRDGMSGIETGDENVDNWVDIILRKSIGSAANDLLIDIEENRILKEVAGYLYDIATDAVVLDFNSLSTHIADDVLKKYREDAALQLLASLASVYEEDAADDLLRVVTQAFKYGEDILKYTFMAPELIINEGDGKLPWESIEGDEKEVFDTLGKIGGGLKLTGKALKLYQNLSDEYKITCSLILSNYDATKEYLTTGEAMAKEHREDELAEVYSIAIGKLDDYYNAIAENYCASPWSMFTNNGDDIFEFVATDVSKYAMKLAGVSPTSILKKSGGSINYYLWLHSATKLVFGRLLGGNSLYDNQESILEDLLVVDTLEKDVEIAVIEYNRGNATTEDILKRVITLGYYKKQLLKHLSAYEDARWFTVYKNSIDSDLAGLDETIEALQDYLNQ